jgi:hypothetical protein
MKKKRRCRALLSRLAVVLVVVAEVREKKGDGREGEEKRKWW